MDDFLPSPGSPNWTVDANGNLRDGAMNAGITPVFYKNVVKNEAKSKEEGRPVFDEVEEVRIFVAGDQFNQATHPVTPEIIERFPEAYRKFRAGHEQRAISGTPIEHWPILTAVQVAELKAINVFTVEALAAMADTNLSRIMDGRILRDKATAWLAAAKDGAAVARYLDVDSIGGAATKFPLTSIFQLGGHLVCGASWAISSNSGLYQVCAFFTSMGEVAIWSASSDFSSGCDHEHPRSLLLSWTGLPRHAVPRPPRGPERRSTGCGSARGPAHRRRCVGLQPDRALPLAGSAPR